MAGQGAIVVGGFVNGLGLVRWTTRCGAALGHDGVFPGWRTIVYARPNGSRVVLVMVNIDPTRVSDATLHATAARALCGS